MARRKVCTTVYLTEEQVRSLKALNEIDGVPMAVMIRSALDDYLDARRHEIPPATVDPRQMTLPMFGETDDSERDPEAGDPGDEGGLRGPCVG